MTIAGPNERDQPLVSGDEAANPDAPIGQHRTAKCSPPVRPGHRRCGRHSRFTRQPRNARDRVKQGTSPGLLASTVQTIAAAKVIA